MSRVVAFLRGMNLGGRRLSNEELTDHFRDVGFEAVAAYRASGNVVFDDPETPYDELVGRIASHLEVALGYPVETFVRSIEALRSVAGGDDLVAAEADGYRVHVIFLHRPPDPSVVAELGPLETPDDRLRVRGREIFWLRRGRLTDSTIPSTDTGVLTGGAPHTMRTLGTVRGIVEKFG